MLNHVTLLGRLAQTPELKTTPNGKMVTSFDLAVPVPGRDKDAQPDYIPVVCWEQKADFVNRYLAKGRQIVVEGRITVRRYTDKDGKNRKAFEVTAQQIYFADSGAPAAREGTQPQQAAYNPPAPNYEDLGPDDELPF